MNIKFVKAKFMNREVLFWGGIAFVFIASLFPLTLPLGFLDVADYIITICLIGIFVMHLIKASQKKKKAEVSKIEKSSGILVVISVIMSVVAILIRLVLQIIA